MTTLNTPRSNRTEQSKGNTQQSPALYGALSAASRSFPPKITTANDAGRAPLPAQQFTPASQASSQSLGAALVPHTAANGSSSESSKARSPSSVAATLATARLMHHPMLPPRIIQARSVSREQSLVTRRFSLEEDTSHEVLPSLGTVTGVKSVFESLEADKSRNAVHRSQTTLATSSSAIKNTANNATNPVRATQGKRPKLSIEVSPVLSDPVAGTGTVSAEIHSPKPLRPTLGVSSFEAVAATSAYGSATSSLVVVPFRSTVVEADAKAKNQKKPPRPPARRAPQTVIGEIKPRPHTGVVSRLAEAQRIRQRPRSNSLTGITCDRTRGTLNPTSAAFDQADARRVESLANAIVASNLASSRAPSPAKSPAPPGLQRRETDAYWYSLTQRQAKVEHRTPSPKKPMLKTMRKPPSPLGKDPESGYQGRSHLFRNPHKHHEGTRKRWREEISEEERKRYEGLWAANRDLYVTLNPDELHKPDLVENARSYVSGLVVKDIWTRSRLPHHVLEEIWDLVDQKQSGRLGRDSFVVGTWLVDQRLKGKKVPFKVGESVWQSARGIYGLKVPKHKR